MTQRRHTRSLKGADPLWSTAPLVLLRYPGLFAAIAASALLLSLATAVYPLFISASASELIGAKVDDPAYTRWAAGIMFRSSAMPVGSSGQPSERAQQSEDEFDRLTASSPYVGDPVRTIITAPVSIGDAEDPSDTREVRLFAREQATSQVDILEGTLKDGALVPDHVAEALHLSPGDSVVLVSDRDGTTDLSVGGLYRSLYLDNLTGYWRPWRDELIVRCDDDGECPVPPQPVIVPEGTLLGSAAALRIGHAGYSWQAPIERELTLDEAEDAARRATSIIHEMSERTPFTRCLTFTCSLKTTAFGSSIGEIVRDTHERIGAIEEPAKLLRAAGVLVALAVVAGAGAFAMAARRVESALLFARGARPSAVGGRAALEAALPSLAGAAAGLGLAFLLIPAIGPEGAIAATASSAAVRATIVAGAVAVSAIAVVWVVTFLRQSEQRGSRVRVLAVVPWELVVIVAAYLVLARLRAGGAVEVNEVLDTRTPSVLLLVFPVLFLAGFVALAARAVVLLTRWVRGRSSGLPTAPYLALHRLAARPQLTLLLITASGLCLGLFVQAQTVVRSMQTTVDVKAGVYVGSDVAVSIDRSNDAPTDFPLPTTRVVQRLLAGDFHEGLRFDLLAIDSDTFADAVFWDPAFGAETAQELVEELRGSQRSALPIVLAAGAGLEPATITIDTTTVPVDLVARTEAFPGMTSIRPLIVVEAERFALAFEGQANPLALTEADHELWIRGDPDEVIRALPELPFTPGLVLEAERVKDIPYISAVIDTFIVMNGLGLLAALLVFAAMLMYLQAPAALRDCVVRVVAADGDAPGHPPGRDRGRGRRDAPRGLRCGRGARGRRGSPSRPAPGSPRGDPTATDRGRSGCDHRPPGPPPAARGARRRVADRTPCSVGRPRAGDAHC